MSPWALWHSWYWEGRQASKGRVLNGPATTLNYYTNIYSIIRPHIKKLVVDSWKLAAIGKRWRTIVMKSVLNNIPLDLAVSTCRMATGHNCLKNTCAGWKKTFPLCHQEESSKGAEYHLHCTAQQGDTRDDTIQRQARLYRTIRRQMADHPTAVVGWTELNIIFDTSHENWETWPQLNPDSLHVSLLY